MQNRLPIFILPLFMAAVAFTTIPALGLGPSVESGRKRAVIRAISAGGAHTCVLASNGRVRCWGLGNKGQTGDPILHRILARPDQGQVLLAHVRQVAAGREATCLVTLDQGLQCLGANDEGQLGPASELDFTAVPARIVGIFADAASVALGDDHACVLNRQGGVQCWGSGAEGQLGVQRFFLPESSSNSLAARSGPRATEEAGTVIVAGSDGAAPAGHLNGSVERGNDDWMVREPIDPDERARRISRIPLTVDGLAVGVMQVAAGATHNCAVTSRGRIWCWGSNAFGQLGDGTRMMRISPVRVSGLDKGVTQVALGEAHSCALMSDGSVRCWGTNARGELGDGTAQERHSPVLVKGLRSATAVQITAGAFHACALLSSGTVKCWGYNRFGQLGDGTISNRLVPVTVKGLPTDIVQISAGSAHTCALSADGEVFCWGSNQNGQLGNGLSGARNDALVAVKALPAFPDGRLERPEG